MEIHFKFRSLISNFVLFIVKYYNYLIPRSQYVVFFSFLIFFPSFKMTQVKIWGERRSGPIAVLKPHDGQPVNSVTFSVAPEHPDHIVLLTTVYIWSHCSSNDVIHSVFAMLYAYQRYLTLKIITTFSWWAIK